MLTQSDVADPDPLAGRKEKTLSDRKRRKRASRKEIAGWAMFDFANQAYTLLIITVIYPVLFTTVIAGSPDDGYRMGNLLWSVSLAISYFLVILAAPLLGAIMDIRAEKKRYLFFSYLLTVISTSAFWFIEPGSVLLGMVLLIISNFGYSLGETIIASFLPGLGPAVDYGKISGFGWSVGYIGGLVSAGFVVLFLGEPVLENFERIRWVGPFAAGFFLMAAIPTFLWLKEPVVASSGRTGASFRDSMSRLRHTIRELSRFRDLSVFLLSVFFEMAGIYIIITYAFIYGDQVIGWDEEVRASMFLVVQITAAAGALLFGFIQDRAGALRINILILILWFVAVMAIVAVVPLTEALSSLLGRDLQEQYVFLVTGLLAGSCLGSSQSASRTLVGLFTPDEKAAEFFGFWGVFYKLAGIFGIMGLGLLQSALGLNRAIVFCALLFLMAAVICLFVHQQRGEAAAEQYGEV